MRAFLLGPALALALCGVANAQSTGPSGTLAGAVGTSTVATPAGPNSTSSFTMQGLAGAITPAKSGTVLFMISATAINGSDVTAAQGLKCQISYGTGTAPTANAALAGTQIGTIMLQLAPSAVTSGADKGSYTITAVATGLTISTAYWYDLACEAVGGTGWSFNNVNLTAVEQ